MSIENILDENYFSKEKPSSPLVKTTESKICNYNLRWVESCIYDHNFAYDESEFSHFRLSKSAIENIRSGNNFESIFTAIFKNNYQKDNKVFRQAYMTTLQQISLGYLANDHDYLASVDISIHKNSKHAHISFNGNGKDTVGVHAKLLGDNFFYSYGNEQMNNCETRSYGSNNEIRDYITSNYGGRVNENFDFVESYSPPINTFNCDITINPTKFGYEMIEKSFGGNSDSSIGMYHTIKETVMGEDGSIIESYLRSQLDETCCMLPVSDGSIMVLGYSQSAFNTPPSFEQ